MKRSRESDSEEASNLLSQDIKSRLLHSLEHLSSTMSFASSGSCPIAENPGIWIRGIGGIGLPLSERDAELISKVTHPAPYGKGPDTIVDPTFRKTQELNADEFELRNPEWNTALESVVRRAAIELGVPGEPSGVKAVLYKILLYGEGAMFKEHRDSQKHPEMFGTLVICLPSKHEGGEVRVTHGGKEKILKTADSSEFGFTYLCWYGDIKHEIALVTSGYRLVLTYNLINAHSNPAKTPVEFDTKKNELENALTFWKDNYTKNASDCPKLLVYILEHLYTTFSLSYSRLKGGDALKGQCLAELCGKHGFEFFLAELEFEVEGTCADEDNDEGAWKDMYWRSVHNEEPETHWISEIQNERLSLGHIVDLEGAKLLNTVPLNKSQIVQEDPFSGDPDDEDFSGPTGNCGVSATHYYRRSAAIIIPSEYRLDFLSGHGTMTPRSRSLGM